MKATVRTLIFLCLLALAVKGKAFAGAADSTRTLGLSIKPVFGDADLVLEKTKYVNAAGDTILFERFRFYLSSIELVFSDGQIYRETDSYHLVDAEEAGTLNILLKGVPKGRLVKIKFNIGVDSVKSVSGAMRGDLDPRHGMYWAWNSGYINAKLEGRSKSCRTHENRFEFHIGGYAFPENALRTAELSVAEKNLEGNEIRLSADASVWFNDISLKTKNGVMIPGKEAMAMADNYLKMFKLILP